MPAPCLEAECVSILLSEVHRKTGAELISNGIVGWNLGTKQKVRSQIPPHNDIVDEVGTSFLLKLGKANKYTNIKHSPLTVEQRDICVQDGHRALPTTR